MKTYKINYILYGGNEILSNLIQKCNGGNNNNIFKVLTYNILSNINEKRDNPPLAFHDPNYTFDFINPNYTFDFIALQNMKQSHITDLSGLRDKMECIIWNPQSKKMILTEEKNPFSGISLYRPNMVQIGLFYDKKYTLSICIAGHLYNTEEDNTRHDKTRPYILAIFDNIDPPLCYINLYQGNGSNIHTSYNQIIKDIMYPKKLSTKKHINIKYSKNPDIDNDKVKEILKKCRYIISGDFNIDQKNFNLFENSYFDFKVPMKNISDDLKKGTCCINSSSYDKTYDHILSSGREPIKIEYPKVTHPISVHLPVISWVIPEVATIPSKPIELPLIDYRIYYIYLVAYDFWDHFKETSYNQENENSKTFWTKNGDNYPYCILFDKSKHDIKDLEKTVEKLAFGKGKNRWFVGDKDSNTIKKHNKKWKWRFNKESSKNIINLQAKMEILGFKNKKSDLDFILGHASNNINFDIIKYGIKKCKDFRLVISERYNNWVGKSERNNYWIANYPLYE